MTIPITTKENKARLEAKARGDWELIAHLEERVRIDGALRAIKKLVFLMCEEKPDQKTQKEAFKVWDQEMQEVRKWAISLHERGNAWNLEELRRKRLGLPRDEENYA